MTKITKKKVKIRQRQVNKRKTKDFKRHRIILHLRTFAALLSLLSLSLSTLKIKFVSLADVKSMRIVTSNMIIVCTVFQCKMFGKFIFSDINYNEGTRKQLYTVGVRVCIISRYACGIHFLLISYGSHITSHSLNQSS